MTVELTHVLSMTAVVSALPEINKGIIFPITDILILPLLKRAWIVRTSLSEGEGE